MYTVSIWILNFFLSIYLITTITIWSKKKKLYCRHFMQRSMNLVLRLEFNFSSSLALAFVIQNEMCLMGNQYNVQVCLWGKIHTARKNVPITRVYNVNSAWENNLWFSLIPTTEPRKYTGRLLLFPCKRNAFITDGVYS